MAAVQDSRWTQISEAILGHFARHPAAKDTLRGVTYWCHAALGIPISEALVEEILKTLEAQNLIASSKLVDGTLIFHAAS